MDTKFVMPFAVLAAAFMLAVGMPAAAQTRQHDTDSLLRAVRERDQKLRMDVMNYYAKGLVDSVMLAAEQLEQTDVENQRIVFGLLDAGGWPEGLSDEANSAIFLVVDHADVEAQRRYYRDVVKAARRGYIDRGLQVTLRDRILMRGGKRQVYGTQTVSFARGDSTVCYVWPVVRSRSIDRRRSRVNLPAMDRYVELVGDGFGFDVVWDRSLNVEELERMRRNGAAVAADE